nr:pumilio homolog 24 isoform X4 [Aegilops tauschii subsp. strangulata]
MAGDGDHPGANKREREAVGRPEAPSKGGGDAVKRKKPYDAPGARGGGSKEKPQPVTAMEKRVAAEEIFLPESRKPDYKLVKEITVLCQKVRCCNLSGKERSKLLTEALRKMDGKYLEIAGSPVAASVLKLCVQWCSQSEMDPVFVALQPHLLDLSRNKDTGFLVNYIIKGASKEQFALFISSLHGHVASLLHHTIGASVVDRAFHQATRPQKRSLLLELCSTELQLSKDLAQEKQCRLSVLNIISKHGLQKSSVLQHMTTIIQPVLEKGIVEYSIVHMVISEYLTIADKTSALDVIRQLIPHLIQGSSVLDEDVIGQLIPHLTPTKSKAQKKRSKAKKKRSSELLLIRIMQTKEGLKLGLACLKHGLEKDRKRIIKSLKGHIRKLALNDYGCLFVICRLSIVDNTELITEVVVDELTKHLKELIFDKNGRRPLLQLFHPLCSRYLTPRELFYLNYNVPSPVSKVNLDGESDDVADKEHGGSEDTLVVSDSNPIKRRQVLLVKSELYEVLVETCIENVGELLRANFGKDVLYEVEKNNFLEGVTDRIHVLHNAIACDAARPRTDDVDEHAFDNYHSSRIIRRMVLDCPAFAATLWKKALEGKCKLYADGFRYLKMTHHRHLYYGGCLSGISRFQGEGSCES